MATQISISETVSEQIDSLTEQLNMSVDELLHAALSNFPISTQDNSISIKQGNVHWVRLQDDFYTSSNISHPHVVIQDDILNRSRIHTVVVCSITTNLRHANYPGNVFLEIAEANLPKQSIIEVSKVSTIQKSQLGDFIGTLSDKRIQQVFAGMQLLYRSHFNR